MHSVGHHRGGPSIYLDLVSAFASMIRELLFTDCLSDEAVCKILRMHQLPATPSTTC